MESFNNNDNSCSTFDFDWVVSSGWSINYSYNNYMSFNTNDITYGYVEIWAKTCCNSTRVKLYTVYFGSGDCGQYFMVSQNPSNNSMVINTLHTNLNEKVANSATLGTQDKCLLTVVDKSGFIRYKTEFKGFPYTLVTSNLSEGLYFINLQYLGNKSTIRLVVKH